MRFPGGILGSKKQFEIFAALRSRSIYDSWPTEPAPEDNWDLLLQIALGLDDALKLDKLRSRLQQHACPPLLAEAAVSQAARRRSGHLPCCFT